MDYNTLLNEEQIKPVEATEGAVLVLAGAGSGKTRVLTYRIAYLIEKNNVSPYNILAITFTNKAAKEMTDRIQRVTGQSNIFISTFHSFCGRILRQEIDVLGYDKNFAIYDAGDSNRLISKIIKSKGVEGEELLKLVKWHISTAKNTALTPEKYKLKIQGISNEDFIIEVFTEYEKELKKSNALDFDDLISKTVEIFVKHTEILAKYQERFKYIHIDEFQDTNKIQYFLVRLLADKHKNIFIVGDDDQSIYGWRGAEIENIINFKKHFSECKVFKLQKNYRSTKSILNCANKLIENNTQRMGKTLWTDNIEGNCVHFESCYDEKAEVNFVLTEVKKLKEIFNFSNKDFAILVRANSLTRNFEEGLSLYNIPYKIYGGFKFYERAEVKAVMSYLRILVNNRDRDAILRIINFPKRNIGEAAINKLEDYCKTYSVDLFDTIINIRDNGVLPTSIINKIKVFADLLIDLINGYTTMEFESFIDYMYERIDFYTVYDIDSAEMRNKIENIQEFLNGCKQHLKNNKGATLSEYLQSVSLISDDNDEQENEDSLTLATIHAVKGLEFKNVFIVGAEDGIFPSMRVINNPNELQEERRIMYVAITRAEERVFVSSAQTRYRYGKRESNLPSRFIAEAGISNGKSDKNHAHKKNSLNYNSDKRVEDILKANSSQAQNQSEVTYKKDMLVEHKKFGIGKIIEVQGFNASIEFEKLGIKIFNTNIAPLKICQQ